MLAVVSVCGIIFSLYKVTAILLFSVLIVFYADFNLLKNKKYVKAIVWCVILVIAFCISYIRCSRLDEQRNKYLSEITDGESVYIFGKIYKSEYKNNSYTYYLQNDSGYSILIYSDADILSVGDIPTIKGKVKKFASATNEGEFDREKFYASQMILFALEPHEIIDKGKTGYNYRKLIYDVKDRLFSSLNKISSAEEIRTLCTMLLGEKSVLSEETKELYQNAGISHILAISGLHISMIGMGLYAFLRKRRSGFVCSMVICAVTTYIYYFMSGATPTTERALVMFVLSMIAQTLGRSNDMLNSLGISVMILVSQNPFIVSYAGFVFSVISVMGVALVVKNIEGGKVKTAIFSSAAMQLSTLPVVAFYYFEIPTYAVFVNAIILPFMSVVFIFGLLAAFIGIVSTKIASIVIIPSVLILRGYDYICRFVSELGFSKIITGCPYVRDILIYYAVFLIVVALTKKYKNLIAKIIYTCILVCMLFLLPRTFKPAQIDMLDVGQGDGIYIQTESEMHILIDGGSSTRKNVGENIILPFLKYNGVAKIDYWFISHADEDHINGFMEILQSEYDIENIVIARAGSDDEKVKNIIEAAADKGTNVIQIAERDMFDFDDMNLYCLAPGAQSKSENINDNCLTLLLVDRENGFKAIFGGDISSDVEKVIADKYNSKIDVDVYKVNHHGSKFSSSKQWLRTISPEVSIISCGKNNSYGHPHDDTLERLRKNNSTVYRTDYDGRIKIVLLNDKRRYFIEKWK